MLAKSYISMDYELGQMFVLEAEYLENGKTLKQSVARYKEWAGPPPDEVIDDMKAELDQWFINRQLLH